MEIKKKKDKLIDWRWPPCPHHPLTWFSFLWEHKKTLSICRTLAHSLPLWLPLSLRHFAAIAKWSDGPQTVSDAPLATAKRHVFALCLDDPTLTALIPMAYFHFPFSLLPPFHTMLNSWLLFSTSAYFFLSDFISSQFSFWRSRLKIQNTDEPNELALIGQSAFFWFRKLV